MIKVSVIIPIYNVSKYLEEFLVSLQKQTFKDIEIILINDGSTDGSLEIIEKYILSSSNMRVINNEKNIGAGYSRNIGLKNAKGKYIIFLDSDDIVEEDFIKQVYAYTSRFDADICFFDVATYDVRKNKIEYKKISPYYRKKIKSRMFRPEEIKENIFHIFILAPFSRMYKKQYLDKIQIQYQNTNNANDVFFGLYSVAKADKLVYFDSKKPLYYYRVNREGQISLNRSNYPLCIFETLNETKRKLIQANLLKVYKRSFLLFCINNIIYTYNACNKEAQVQINKYLELNKDEFFDFLDNINDIEGKDIYYRELILWAKDEKRLLRGIKKGAFLYNSSEGIHIIIEYINNNFTKIALWGAGLYGRKFMSKVKKSELKIDVIIDQDEDKCGTKLEGINIKKPNEINLNNIDLVLITNSRYAEEIYATAKKYNNKIKVLDLQLNYRDGIEIQDCFIDTLGDLL